MRPDAAADVAVSVIVLAFGKDALLVECLRSIDDALEALDQHGEVLVVLNAVSAQTRHALEAGATRRILVDPGRNLGFAGGVAAGLERARGDWIALVNDDCVVDRGALAELMAVGAARPDVGSVAAQVRFARRDDVVNSAGLEIDTLGVAYERLLGEPAPDSGHAPVDVFGASGAAAFYRRAMLDDVGGFDQSFFAYLEDADLAWRAQMRGWRAVYAPRAIVRHHHSASLGHRSPTKHFLVGRNRVRMLAKNATRGHLLRHGLAIVLYDIGYVLFVAVSARTLAPLRGRLRGLWEWPAYRAAGASRRAAVRLAPARGVRGALRRDRAYGAS